MGSGSPNLTPVFKNLGPDTLLSIRPQILKVSGPKFLFLLGPRVRLVVDAGQVLEVEVGVNLGG